MNRESLGTEIETQPRAVYWMTVGQGIVNF